MEVEVRRLVTPAVKDVVTGDLIPSGPATDDAASWNHHRRTHPKRFYAVAKRALSRRELRRHGLCDSPPEDN